jgi:DNA-binding transcriptional MerR regulator
MARISYRQIDYWERTGLLRCTYIDKTHGRTVPEGGTGTSRRFDSHNAIKAMAIGWMLRQGLTLPVIRALLRHDQVAEVILHSFPEVSR